MKVYLVQVEEDEDSGNPEVVYCEEANPEDSQQMTITQSIDSNHQQSSLVQIESFKKALE